MNFVILYCIGEYLRKFRLTRLFYKYSLLIYLYCTLINYTFGLIGWDNAWKTNPMFNVVDAISF